MKKTKHSYLNMDLQQFYFKEKLIKTVKYSPCFVISYDESLNNILQEQQMDVCKVLG